MDGKKYIGMDVHQESISIAVSNDAGKIVMECVIETKASMVLDFIDGLRGDLQVTLSNLPAWVSMARMSELESMCFKLRGVRDCP